MRILFLLLLTGCQIPYLIENGYHQALIIKNQKPVPDVYESLTEQQKKKINLINRAKEFSQNELGLVKTKNYTSYVDLNREYVTYIVQVAYPMELKYHYWRFPLVGKVPYKGYFNKDSAKKEATEFKTEGYDTSVRGVRAFSYLGWLNDPILSPMTNYDDDELVNLIIHETTHSTIFIKDEVDYNEQLATFVGNKGTELFYEKIEGKSSPTLQLIKDKNADEKVFSEFITKELKSLEEWYKSKPDEKLKPSRLLEIQKRFASIKFKTDNFKGFEKMELNNAVLLGYKTYNEDLSKFETAYQKAGGMKQFIEELKSRN